MSNGDDFFDDRLAGPTGTQQGVEGVLRDLRRLADQPAPRPGAELAAFLAAAPTVAPAGRLTPVKRRITRLAARAASMGAAGAIVLGGGAVAMACVGVVTVAHVTSQDPKPPAVVSTLLPTHSEASESPEVGATATRSTAPTATTTHTTVPAKSPEANQTAEPSGSPGQDKSGANHNDGQGQDDQRAHVNSGGPVNHQSDQWRQGLGQGFSGPKAVGGAGGFGRNDGTQQGGGR
ncbi:MAG TPA: hypothetical protein VIM19_14665 [Actinomycetes bacterium]